MNTHQQDMFTAHDQCLELSATLESKAGLCHDRGQQISYLGKMQILDMAAKILREYTPAVPQADVHAALQEADEVVVNLMRQVKEKDVEIEKLTNWLQHADQTLDGARANITCSACAEGIFCGSISHNHAADCVYTKLGVAEKEITRLTQTNQVLRHKDGVWRESVNQLIAARVADKQQQTADASNFCHKQTEADTHIGNLLAMAHRFGETELMRNWLGAAAKYMEQLAAAQNQNFCPINPKTVAQYLVELSERYERLVNAATESQVRSGDAGTWKHLASMVKRTAEVVGGEIRPSTQCRANFLWPHDTGSISEAGYEFANAQTEDYRNEWWMILMSRIREDTKRMAS